MKNFVSILTASILAAAMLTGCTNANSGSAGSDTNADTASQATLKIGLTMSNRDQWLSTMEQAALDAAKKQGVALKSFDANVDVVTQLSHVTACANDGYDAMIVNLVNTDNAQEMVAAAGDMPIVFVNRLPGDPDNILSADQIVYVGSNEEESGTFQGKYIAEALKSAGKTEVNIAMLTGTLGMQATTMRTNYAKQALENSGLQIHYIFEDTADWDRAKAMEKFVQFMGTGKPYDAVICNNDEMALGVVEAMKTTGEGKITVPVAGVDATDSALQSVKAGDLTFTVFQNAIGQGEGAVESAIKLAKGENCEIYSWIPFEPVDASNVDDYM